MAWQEGDRTICEVLRQIADLCAEDEQVISLIIEAADMAKRMDSKLKEYKPDYYDGFWKGQDYQSSRHHAHKERLHGKV